MWWWEEDEIVSNFERAYIKKREAGQDVPQPPSDFRQLVTGGYPYADQTEHLLEYYDDKKQIWCNEDGYGKTTFLSMFRYFYDKNETEDLFQDMKIAQLDPNYKERMHTCDIISLDFSAFQGKSFQEACRFIGAVMAEAYGKLADDLLDIQGSGGLSEYIDILENKADLETLAQSLKELIKYHQRLQVINRVNNRQENKLVVLIDNLIVTEIYARHYGFAKEMKDFNSRFILDAVPREPMLFIQAGDMVPLKYRLSGYGCIRYMDTYIRKFPDLHKETPQIYTFNAPKKETGQEKASRPIFDHTRIPALRRKVIQLRKEEQERAEEGERQEKELYAAPLPDGAVIPSVHAGVRDYSMPVNSDAYRERNEYLHTLYADFDPKQGYEALYEKMQYLDEDTDTDWSETDLRELKEFADHIPDRRYNMNTNSNTYWDYFFVTPLNDDRDIYIYHTKVYITVKNSAIKDLFSGAVKTLLEQGKHSFSAKVSRKKRLEHMCFWVKREDFFLLERYFLHHEDKLITPMPFVAYRGKLGISREIASGPSYNGGMAEMIYAYFSSIHGEEEISMADMYHTLVLAWNRELPADHPMRRHFASENAQILLVMLDSMDVILGEKTIDDCHMLLSEDKVLWDALCEGYCWKEVGELLLKK